MANNQNRQILLNKSERHDKIKETPHYEEYLELTANPTFIAWPEAIQECKKIAWCYERGIEVYRDMTQVEIDAELSLRDSLNLMNAMMREGFSLQTEKFDVWCAMITRISLDLPPPNRVTVLRFVDWLKQQHADAEVAYRLDCTKAKEKGVPIPEPISYDLNISYTSRKHISLTAEFADIRANLFNDYTK